MCYELILEEGLCHQEYTGRKHFVCWQHFFFTKKFFFFLTSLCLWKISVPARACSELGRPVFGWVPCLVLLTQCQFPPQRTGLLWRSPTALIQFYSPSTPAHEWCKPIRPMLFIRPLRAIIFPNLERNQPFSFFFSSLYLSSSSSTTPLSRFKQFLHTLKKKKNSVQLFSWMKSKFLCFGGQ